MNPVDKENTHEMLEECEVETRMTVKRKSYRRRKSDSRSRSEDLRSERSSGIFRTTAKPAVYHAVVVIFLEFFAWGLLTFPLLEVLKTTFGPHTFLINGLVQGIKGLLSFLSAPLLGALSDVWGRRMFLVLTVVCTCIPIPLMSISPWWFFALLSISGVCACTFSIVFAYVADITDEEDRSSAYGLVSATFAASLVISPMVGAKIKETYGLDVVVTMASGIALMDIIFILLAVPESLPEIVRPAGWNANLSWDRVDPLSSLRQALSDSTNMILCLCVFLTYIPDAGQVSFLFLYLKAIIGFTEEKVALFIAICGVMSILSQTVLLTTLQQTSTKLTSIMIGLAFQSLNLFLFAFGKSDTIMWTAGAFYAISTITFPAITSLVSSNADEDKQGVVQGMVTGVRGLCTGLGPAIFGIIFTLFGIDKVLDDVDKVPVVPSNTSDVGTPGEIANDSILPGPPFLFGGCSVILAIIFVALFPTEKKAGERGERSRSGPAEDGDPVEISSLLKQTV